MKLNFLSEGTLGYAASIIIVILLNDKLRILFIQIHISMVRKHSSCKSLINTEFQSICILKNVFHSLTSDCFKFRKNTCLFNVKIMFNALLVPHLFC